MRDWTKTRERYLALDASHQLGHIASSLARIKSQIYLDIPLNGVLATIEECQHWVEWTISDAEIHDELVKLAQLLGNWQQNEATISSNPTVRATIAEQAKVWSDRILDYSGLLSEQD